ncbi:MAG TPA: VanZ family protein [Anaerolineaceae bacterium]|nr:VanZ family protein [Anaerolineaceae bacterium]
MKSNWFSRWFPVALIAAVIYWLSSEPDPYGLLPKNVYQWIYLTHIFNIRLTKIVGPLAHLTLFALFAFLLTRAIGQGNHNTRKIGALVLALTFLYALSDEFHQLFVPGRAFEITDLALDFLGGAAGLIIWHLLTNIRRKVPELVE